MQQYLLSALPCLCLTIICLSHFVFNVAFLSVLSDKMLKLELSMAQEISFIYLITVSPYILLKKEKKKKSLMGQNILFNSLPVLLCIQ